MWEVLEMNFHPSRKLPDGTRAYPHDRSFLQAVINVSLGVQILLSLPGPDEIR